MLFILGKAEIEFKITKVKRSRYINKKVWLMADGCNPDWSERFVKCLETPLRDYMYTVYTELGMALELTQQQCI